MNLTICKAEINDAHDFAYILCESWKSAYKDLIAADELAKNTDIQARTEMFENIIFMVWGPNTEEQTKAFLSFVMNKTSENPINSYQLAVI